MMKGLVSVFSRFHPRRRSRQRLLPFQERAQRRDRALRGLSLGFTLGVLAAILAAWPTGRSIATGMARRAAWGVLERVGFERPRSEVDSYWRDRRDRREVVTRDRFRASFAALNAAKQAFFRAAGMDPNQAVIRWGNYDMTLVTSGKVFARVDSGRQYQLRPHVRSIWFKQLSVLGMDVCSFLFPDTPEVRRLAGPAGAEIIPDRSQTTNSWGCRGPEPDMNAPIRGLVLGDSFMQGYLVNDDETPPEQLRRLLRSELQLDVALLNTGTLGYCPEHYYYTLREYADRFHPQFVVVSLYSNDFGDEAAVITGQADWAEEKHWLGLIMHYCFERGIRFLFAPIPYEQQLIGPRNSGYYPGQITIITGITGRSFYDLTDAFVDEDLKLRRPFSTGGLALGPRSLLYNSKLGDGHLSPAGAAVWAQAVARRVALVIGSEKPPQAAQGPAEPRR